MKILIFGGNGQLGTDCSQVLKESHEVLALDLEDLDICNLVDVDGIIQNIKPDVVLNCAAYTNVDECETNKDLAWKVNVEGPRNLAITARKSGLYLVHISTDYVFDGKKKVPQPYTEDDITGPVSYYGITKLEGEKAIRQTTDNHMILRTAWLYGIHGRNFLKTILRLALNNPQKEIRVVNDQFGSPTWSYSLAVQIQKLIEVKANGVCHATSEGYCTWYELATCFLGRMGVSHAIVACATKEYLTPAIRPANSILENERLKEMGAHLMKNWKSDLDQFVYRYKERLINEVKGMQ